MSIGALSPEATRLAEAMNGDNANSGEGGEDPARYGTNDVAHQAEWRRSLQHYSAYLVNADG